MIIGILYCGGCNPSYNRVQAKKDMEEIFHDWTFEYYVNNRCYDYVIIFCGCKTQCVNLTDSVIYKVIHINSQNDIKKAIAELKTLPAFPHQSPKNSF